MKLETKVVDLLISKNMTIASAESCTGGLFAGTIINVTNASKVINASIVTYSNEAKQKYCNVKQETLKEFGAVSEQVAKEMAQGIADECKANIGVSFSGIAGPGGATLNKPVGMVCFAISINGEVSTYTKYFKGHRQKVRKQSVRFMLKELINKLS